MTHVSLDGLQIPEDWQRNVANVVAAISAANAEQRATILGQNAQRWSMLNQVFARLKADKCWYCESRQIRSDKSIDHFRPKGAVYEDLTHPGYWWLAFDPSNYRYSCTYCNSRRKDVDTGLVGGKATHFPLRTEATRATAAADALALEEPDLLDPTKPADPPLLFFENNGMVEPVFAKNTNPREFKRAAVSIQLYHLNHSKLARARKRLFNQVRTLVQDGDVYFRQGPDDARVEHARTRVLADILDRSNPDAQYLGAVQRYLKSFVDPERRPWLGIVLGG